MVPIKPIDHYCLPELQGSPNLNSRIILEESMKNFIWVVLFIITTSLGLPESLETTIET